MSTIKTKEHDGNIEEFINSYANTEQKKKDSFELVKFFERTTGFPAKMWGESMIGFGKYNYKSERSRQEGDWPQIAFSPRKAAISLYVYSGEEEQNAYLEELGKFSMGKSCIYVKKLSDINLDVLEKIVHSSMKFIEEKYGKE